MGGDCYRYCILKKGVTISQNDKELYQKILPTIVTVSKKWFEKQNPKKWTVKFDEGNAVEIQVKDNELLKGKIVIPKELNQSLNVGWQHRQYGSIFDPKYDIATSIMDLLLKCDLKYIIEEDNENNIASDLGYFDDYDEEEECQSKGPFHYSCGLTDLDWSPQGMYQGYDDWESYRDADGLD